MPKALHLVVPLCRCVVVVNYQLWHKFQINRLGQQAGFMAALQE